MAGVSAYAGRARRVFVACTCAPCVGGARIAVSRPRFVFVARACADWFERSAHDPFSKTNFNVFVCVRRERARAGQGRNQTARISSVPLEAIETMEDTASGRLRFAYS